MMLGEVVRLIGFSRLLADDDLELLDQDADPVEKTMELSQVGKDVPNQYCNHGPNQEHIQDSHHRSAKVPNQSIHAITRTRPVNLKIPGPLIRKDRASQRDRKKSRSGRSLTTG
jgi:hypothetical protein